MADCAEDSEDATSSLGDEERVRRLFQACDGDGDGFIDSHDLMNICRELNLEESIEDLMRELGADEQGRISYQEFLRRRLALRPEIEAIKNSRPQQAEYLPTSSENSLGEGKMSWEFDSGARDLSPEPHSLQQLVASAPHPASGNLLDLANKLHVAALASLKSEILDLSNRLQCVTQERDHFEKSFHKSEVEKRKAEQKLEEEMQVHEEQLTELHSVIAELTRKAQHQRSLVIREEEDVSETDDNEVSAGVECSQTLPLDEEINEIDPMLETSASSNENDEVVETVEKNIDDTCDLKEELAQVKADNAMLHERLSRALNDLETISKLNSNKKQSREVPTSLEVVRIARVSSPSRVLDRTSPSLVTEKIPSPNRSSPSRLERNVPVPKIAERVRLKKVDNHITGSDIANFGVCHTKVAEHLVSDMQEESDLQELSRGDLFSKKQHELETERLSSRLEHVRAQNTVLGLTLEECKCQCDKLSLLVGKYESNAVALKLALTCSDQALQLSEALLCLLETELSLVLSNCRMQNSSHSDSDENRFMRRASENRRKAEKHAKELMEQLDVKGEGAIEWTPADTLKLRDRISQLKSERNTVKSTVVELESPHVQPFTSVMTLAEARKLDLETAVLMQELMSMREDKAELRARIHLLEKERRSQDLRAAAQNAQLQALLQSIHHLQLQIMEDKGEGQTDTLSKGDSRLKERMEELVGTLDKVTKSSELRYQQNEELVLDLRAANTALVSTLDRCKKKYQGRLKKLETQMMSLVERHAQQVRTLKQRISVLEEQNQARSEACEKELERLKQEEVFIKELLRDVQKQLGKYKVEGLHMSHISALGDDYTIENIEEGEETDGQLIRPEMMDAADIINKSKLDLDLRNIDDFEESEESDISE